MIIVLGPGRCGSSAIARILHNNLGVSMGYYFRDPDDSNPQGFFEDLDFRNINEMLLNNQCSIEYFKEQLNRLVRSRKGRWGIKDPRICHLWQYYQKYDAQFIVCARRPQLIVKSMMTNYSWSENESQQLLLTRLNGIDRLLEGRDALRIDFSIKREDSELINLLQNHLRLK